jgi:hypothetical protein
MSQLTCIRIGYGKVAKIHQQELDFLKVKTLGVIEKNLEKQEQAKKKRITSFPIL